MNVTYPVAALALLLSMLYLIAKPLLGQGVVLRGTDLPSAPLPTDDPPAGIGTAADEVEQRIARRKRAMRGNRCAGCGHVCDDGDRFCRSCGTSLEVAR